MRSNKFLPPLWVIIVAILLFAAWLIVQLKEIVVLLVVGYCIVYLIEPILEYCEKRQIRRGMGVFIVLSSLVIVLMALVLTALPTLLREFAKLSSNLPSYLDQARLVLGPGFEKVKSALQQRLGMGDGVSLQDLIMPWLDIERLRKIFNVLVSTLISGYSIPLTVANLLLLPFIVFYLAIDFQHLHTRALQIFPLGIRRKVEHIALEIDGYISAFVRAQFLVCCILFFLYALGLGLIKVELWFLLALVSGFGSMVPYLGFLLGIFLSSLMALVTFGDFAHLFVVWGLYALVQFLESTLITPRILGNKVGLSPLVIILAILASGKLFGLLGVFLAVPMAAALKVLLKSFHIWILEQA